MQQRTGFDVTGVPLGSLPAPDGARASLLPSAAAAASSPQAYTARNHSNRSIRAARSCQALLTCHAILRVAQGVSSTAGTLHCKLPCRPLLMSIFITTTLLTASLAFKATPFAWAASVLLTAEAFRGAVPALADAIVTAATTDDHQYGRCRLWGAIAWGSVSVVSGFLIEKFGFTTLFAIFAATALSGDL